MNILSFICELLNGVLGGIANTFPRFGETAAFGALAGLVDALCPAPESEAA